MKKLKTFEYEFADIKIKDGLIISMSIEIDRMVVMLQTQLSLYFSSFIRSYSHYNHSLSICPFAILLQSSLDYL